MAAAIFTPSSDRDTIFALSSGAGRAAVAVIRVSGPAAGQVLAQMVPGRPPAPRRAALRAIQAPGGAEPLDRALVLWLPGPASFTGEDQVELHLHGGRAVVAAVLEALGGLPGCRLAEAGEFTRRAYDAGKLDLAQVEGLADLINAETEAQRRQALRQSQGALSRRCNALQQALIAALARLEAEIDFAEDEVDVPARPLAAVQTVAGALRAEIAALLDQGERGERLRDGVQIAILGAPNVGKSSLLNALARRDVAIVSAQAGTTRDVIEVHLDLGGLPVTLADTAGLRDLVPAAEDPSGQAEVEAEGMRRSRLRAEDADLKLLVFEAPRWPAVEPEVAARADRDSLVVVNKADLAEGPLAALPSALTAVGADRYDVSALTGAGLDGLLEGLERAVEARLGGADPALLTRARHREALADCAEALGRAAAVDDAALVAEDLRLALRALGRVVGKVDVEALLDVVFREFCIGK